MNNEKRFSIKNLKPNDPDNFLVRAIRKLEVIRKNDMDDVNKICKATEPKELQERLMSASVAKTELEWFAKKQIEELQTELEQIKQIKGFIQMALDELGIPNKDYPAPIANAVDFLREALNKEEKQNEQEKDLATKNTRK